MYTASKKTAETKEKTSEDSSKKNY